MNSRSSVRASLALLTALGLTACSRGDAAPATTAPTTVPATTEPAPTTAAPVPSEPVADVLRVPLTGEPIDSPDQIEQRPALFVKVPMNPGAMPQIGINDADIVFQTVINDQYTRLLAVFQSKGSDPVGPIRSGREQDVDVMSAFSRPLMAWSGGNEGVTKVMVQADSDGLLTNLNFTTHGNLYYRGRGKAPLNLFSKTTDLWAAGPDEVSVPHTVFPYLAPGAEPTGDPATEINVTLDSIKSKWVYDPESQRYLKFNNGSEHVTQSGDSGVDEQVWADNVVVLVTDYTKSSIDARNPVGNSLGSNPVFIFSHGTVRQGVWVRYARTDPWGFFNSAEDLTPIGLVAGRTWLEMPRSNEGVLVYKSNDEDITPPITIPSTIPGSLPAGSVPTETGPATTAKP